MTEGSEIPTGDQQEVQTAGTTPVVNSETPTEIPLQQIQKSRLSPIEKELIKPLATGEAGETNIPALPKKVGFLEQLRNIFSQGKQREESQKNNPTIEAPGPTPQS